MENILQPLIEELQNVKLEKQAYQKSLEVSLLLHYGHTAWTMLHGPYDMVHVIWTSVILIYSRYALSEITFEWN